MALSLCISISFRRSKVAMGIPGVMARYVMRWFTWYMKIVTAWRPHNDRWSAVEIENE